MPEQPSEEMAEEQYPTVIYQKHKIKRYRKKLGNDWFWVADIWKPDAKEPYASLTFACDRYTLKDANDEADRLVGVMMANDGKIPAGELGAHLTFDHDNDLQSLNPKSESGKPQWCPEHWKTLRDGMVAGTHNGFVAGILLTSITIQKLQSDGLLRGNPSKSYTMELVRDSYSPFCCWLGQGAVDQIMRESEIERISQSGILQQIEAQLLNRKR